MGGATGRPHPRDMDSTTAPTPPDRPSSANRTGATWVAGTGAFLLLAATALFVAVRWDDIPGAAKLGMVGAGAAWAALASAVIAAIAIGAQAKARGDNALAGLAVAVLAAGVMT